MQTPSQPIFTERSDWKGTEYISELYDATDFSTLSPITQVQAVCFSDENHKVNLPDKPVQDPCGKALERIVVPVDEAIQKLNWGKKGEILVPLAVKRYQGTAA